MPVEDTLKKLVDAINGKDQDAFVAIYASDAILYQPGSPDPFRGRDEILGSIEVFFQAFPDLHMEIATLMSQGDKGVMEVEMSGTNTGPMESPDGPIPATNKRVTLRGVGVVIVNTEGLITEDRQYYDTASMLGQMGLIPES